MSTADRIKNNELKLQQEKVRKDIRKKLPGGKKKKKSFAVSITAGLEAQLSQTYFRGGKSVKVFTLGLSGVLAAQSNHHHAKLGTKEHPLARQHGNETQ